MKKFLKPLAIVFCLAAAVSCKKNQVIAYTDPVYDNPITDYDIIRDPNDAFTFTFKNKTTNYGRLEWRFGDDTLATDSNPVHTYLATGMYTVDLKAFSKTNKDQSTRKLVDLYLVPDSIVQVTTTKVESSASASTIQLDLKVKAPIAKVVWTFNDAATSTAAAKTTTSTEQNPLKTYETGTFNSFSVTITTPKGSVVTFSRNITTEGIAEDITQKRVGYTTVLENGDNPQGNESSSKFVDGNFSTKFGLYGKGSALTTFAYTIMYDSQVTVKVYAITNGNDSGNDRDPKEWVLEGSDDGTNWTELDHQMNGTGFYDKANAAGATTDAQRYNRTWYYPIANPKPFAQIRFRTPSGTFNGNDFQLSELQLFR